MNWGLNIHNLSVNCLNPKPTKRLWNFDLHLTENRENDRLFNSTEFHPRYRRRIYTYSYGNRY